jgi:hypothetical protein
VAWRSRRSRWCKCPCSGSAPSPDADGLLSSPRATVEDVILGVLTASLCVRAFPRLDAAATRPLPLPRGVASGVGRKTPMGLVVGALGLRPHPAFESRGHGRQGESPNLPRARPAGRPRRCRLSLQGFPPIATNPLGNTTISVAIGGYYCTETVIWLQFVCLLPHKI